MSYYTLPKKNIDFTINPEFCETQLTPYISISLYSYLKDVNLELDDISNKELIHDISSNTECNIQLLNKIINQYEFIFYKVPNTKISVSKLKPYSNTFYVFMEINNLFSILDFFDNININVMCYGENSTSIVECINMFRENNLDTIWINTYIDINSGSIKSSENTIQSSSINFLYYELEDCVYKETNNYIKSMVFILCSLLYYQCENGICIIKIQDIFYKPILDILYILSSLYEKIYIIKPIITNIISGERYIICKKFILNSHKIPIYNNYIYSLKPLLINYPFYNNGCEYSKNISTIIKNKFSCYFLNKIEESNIIIGHSQIDNITQLINLFKNKNKDDKIENIKKSNIQKCVQWCEKYKIPHNKFTDKINIFLPNYLTGRYDPLIRRDTLFL